MRGIIRAAPGALTLAIVASLTLAAPGDLDPGFGDVGRLLLPELPGPALSVAAQDDGIIVAGGKIVRDFDTELDDQALGFAVRLTANGILDATFVAPALDDIMVVDTELQSDGRIVGVGNHNFGGTGIEPVAFRLDSDGSLDTGFGAGGIVELTRLTAVASVAVDPGGTIVIAGTWAPGQTPGGDLKVMRLLPTGEPDESFGAEGAFALFGDIEQLPSPTHILSAAGGGYRITVLELPARYWKCSVLALTPDGDVDPAFGVDGFAEVGDPGKSVFCESMVEAPDGRLLVAGSEDSRAFLVRLLASGARDPDFATGTLPNTAMAQATDVAVDPDTGAIVVALDDDEPGFAVARLQADGTADASFGEAGITSVDLSTADGRTYFAIPRDATILGNGDVLVAGGSGNPFVARLAGGDGDDGPGVLGVRNWRVEATEDSGQAVVTVRRIGGSTGGISVAYAAVSTGTGASHAVAGQDFTPVSGTLAWAHGDTDEKQIIVPVATDEGVVEETEAFALRLSDVQGGAGLGTPEARVSIASDIPAAGRFAFQSSEIRLIEDYGFVPVTIERDHSSEGAVSVTVTMSSGTATAGEDFEDEPLTVSWADGDYFDKGVDIPIIDDSDDEPREQFSVHLNNPTGGAIIGAPATATIVVQDDDPAPPPPPPPSESGGGGPVGPLTLLLLCVAWLGRRGWRHRSRIAFYGPLSRVPSTSGGPWSTTRPSARTTT